MNNEYDTETSALALYAYKIKLADFYHYYDLGDILKTASLFYQVMQALDIFNRCSQGKER